MKLINMKTLFIATLLLFSTEFLYAETIELVVFKSKVNASSQDIVSAATGMLKTLRGWDGFISRELIEIGKGNWMDIVHWENLEAAQLAQEKAIKCEVCLIFFSLIDDKQQQIYHGESVLVQSK